MCVVCASFCKMSGGGGGALKLTQNSKVTPWLAHSYVSENYIFLTLFIGVWHCWKCVQFYLSLLCLLFHHIAKRLQISKVRDDLRQVSNIRNTQSRRRARWGHGGLPSHLQERRALLHRKGHLTARIGIWVIWIMAARSLNSEEETASVLRVDSKYTDRTELSLSKPWRHIGGVEV